jgi:peptide chain release factor 1
MLPVAKLESIVARHADLEAMLCRQDIASDAKRFTQLNRERADVADLVTAYLEWKSLTGQLADNREAMSDPELRELAAAEIPELEASIAALEASIGTLLLPKDPNDGRDTILEIRAGTGGEEAALFAADLFRMYSRYAEKKGFRVEVTSLSEASAGGIKEVIAIVTGQRVYSQLRFEGGVHRVQRVPATESQGRIHTSTATVAVLPEADDVAVHIDEKDLEISKTAAGGPGGQGVNTTNSAINLRHIPTGIMVRSEEQRSQHQNLERAMQILRAKLLEIEEREQAAQIGAERRAMVGSGERSEKIRTYNYPQNRVTDHRIQLTLHDLPSLLEGNIDELVLSLRNHYEAERIKQESESGA